MAAIFKFLACTCLGAGLAFPAYAQDTDDQKDADREIVVTASGQTKAESGTKTNTALIETPQSVSVITRDEMDVRAVHSVTDALAYTAGVQSEQTGVDSRVDDFTIRGFDGGSFSGNQFLDGMRVPTGGQWTVVSFDPFALDQIEVLKGPAAVLFGQVAPGGLVNMISKRPTTNFRAEMGFQTAIFGDLERLQFTAQADVSGALNKSGTLAARFVGSARYGDTQIKEVTNGRYYVGPSISWNPSADTSLTLIAQYQRDEGGATYQFLPSVGTLYPGAGGRYIGIDTYLGQPDYNTFDRNQYLAGFDFTQRFGVFSFHSKGRYFHLNTLYEVTVLNGGTVASCTPAQAALGCVPLQTINRRAVRGIGESDGIAFDNNLLAEFETGALKHNLLIGADYQHNDWEHYRDLAAAAAVPPIYNIFDPVYPSSAAIRPSLAPQVYTEQVDKQFGIYGQEQIAIGKLRVLFGGRYDWSRITTQNALPAAVLAGTPPVVIKADKFTKRAGLVYLFDNGIAPYVSYAESFQPSSGTFFDGTPFDPTTGQQYEAGIKYQPPGMQAFVTLAAYQLKQQNKTTPDPDPTHICGGGTCNVQTGEGRIRGVELEGKASFPWGLTVVATGTYMRAEITRTNTISQLGNDLDQIPDWMGSLFLDYRFQGPLDGLGLGGGVRYVGESFGDVVNTFAIPSYTLFDAFARYQFDNGIILSLNSRNLANKRYVALTSAVSSSFYGSGRTVNARIQFRF
jgi:iron complex outermembrane receptor protein